MQYWYTIVSGAVDMSIVFVYFGTVNRSCPSRPPWVCGNISRQLFVNHWVGCKEHLQETLFLPHTYYTAVLLHISLPSSSDLHCAPGTSPCPRGPRDNVLAHQWKGAALVFYPKDSNSNRKSSRNGSGAIFSLTFMLWFPTSGELFPCLRCIYPERNCPKRNCRTALFALQVSSALSDATIACG